MTKEKIMEFLVSDEEGLDIWCVDCPEKIEYPGHCEGGLPIEPDEVSCPCDLETGEEGCIMRAEYKEIEKKAAELAELVRASLKGGCTDD
ncbi:hypothetical protein [Cloacibacillus sp.]|uniref:hypothetical protein n=1 Tax=Cloacibacillus sp. TaxID=2049023 RepID=UPI0025C634AE|nr:hypothetical protein [Cloacibacillus sp.]MCC8056407.1 hypothetical protein [Cloacibacillus sp.]MCC8178745.1 hypothetical protein [Cloacibacillus sp.]